MPHAELKYSDDLGLDAGAVLIAIERVLQQHDAGSGECKGRAYPAAIYHHSHCLVEIAMLTKPHRDQAFTDAVIADLERAIKAHIPKPCFFSLDIRYSGAGYITNTHVIEG